MRRASRYANACAVLFVVLAGCTRFTVQTDYDHSASFGGLHSYDWRPNRALDLGDPRINNTLVEARIRTAVDEALAAKGYSKVASGTPDFLVGYHLVVENRTSVQTVNRLYGYRGDWMTSYPDTYAHDYQKGSLLLDVIDPQSMKLLWRGTATAIVDPTASPETREKRISDAVEKILKDFPPKQ